MANKGLDNPELVSILTSTKQNLGIIESYEHFDVNIIMYINSAIAELTQIGVGPDTGYSISDSYAVWSDFLKDDFRLNMVQSYVYLRVKILFDPPQSASVLQAMQDMLSEYAWRINSAVEDRDENV